MSATHSDQTRADLLGNEAHLPIRTASTITSAAFPKWNPGRRCCVEAAKINAMNVTCIRAGVKDLPSAALIAKARHVEACLQGNPHFPSPQPGLDTLRQAYLELERAVAAATGRARADVALRWERHAELERLLVQLAKYVLATAQGDVAKQLTSGFELRRPPVRITTLEAPALLEAKRSAFEGAIKLCWSAVRGARTYEVYVNHSDPDHEAGWYRIASCTRIRTEVRHLPPGEVHHFKVRAILAAGEGPFSPVSSKRAA
jgi:hypothetical protein